MAQRRGSGNTPSIGAIAGRTGDGSAPLASFDTIDLGTETETETEDEGQEDEDEGHDSDGTLKGDDDEDDEVYDDASGSVYVNCGSAPETPPSNTIAKSHDYPSDDEKTDINLPSTPPAEKPKQKPTRQKAVEEFFTEAKTTTFDTGIDKEESPVEEWKPITTQPKPQPSKSKPKPQPIPVDIPVPPPLEPQSPAATLEPPLSPATKEKKRSLSPSRFKSFFKHKDGAPKSPDIKKAKSPTGERKGFFAAVSPIFRKKKRDEHHADDEEGRDDQKTPGSDSSKRGFFTLSPIFRTKERRESHTSSEDKEVRTPGSDSSSKKSYFTMSPIFRKKSKKTHDDEEEEEKEDNLKTPSGDTGKGRLFSMGSLFKKDGKKEKRHEDEKESVQKQVPEEKKDIKLAQARKLINEESIDNEGEDEAEDPELVAAHAEATGTSPPTRVATASGKYQWEDVDFVTVRKGGKLARLQVQTKPLERPRSTTPINIVSFDDYASVLGESPVDKSPNINKIRIRLPGEEFEARVKSPRKTRRESSDFNDDHLFAHSRPAILIAGEEGDESDSPKKRVLIPKPHLQQATVSDASKQVFVGEDGTQFKLPPNSPLIAAISNSFKRNWETFETDEVSTSPPGDTGAPNVTVSPPSRRKSDGSPESDDEKADPFAPPDTDLEKREDTPTGKTPLVNTSLFFISS